MSLPLGACVLPRARVLYTQVDLGGVPRGQWRESVQLELEMNAPFERPMGWVIWHKERALVWYWPGTLQDEIEAALGGEVTVVPETALWPALSPGDYRFIQDASQGTHLLQYWHPAEGLYEKRDARPLSPEEAHAWLTRHRAAVESSPTPAPLPQIAIDSVKAGEPLQVRRSTLETRVLPAMCLLAGILIVIFGVANLRAMWEVDRLQAEKTALETRAETVLDKRDEVERVARFNERLASLATASQVAIAADLARIFELEDDPLVSWKWRNGELSAAWVQTPLAIDAAGIIRRLEAEPSYRDVQARTTKRDNFVEVDLAVTGQGPITAGRQQQDQGETADD